MLIVIRISGMVDVPEKVAYTLDHLLLRRKYSCILMEENIHTTKVLHRVRSFVAFGKISEQMLMKLISIRAQPIKKDMKVDPAHIVKNLDKKDLKELGLKPFFRLHPPRKGIESKKHFGVGKGVLGDNKEHINLLLERML